MINAILEPIVVQLRHIAQADATTMTCDRHLSIEGVIAIGELTLPPGIALRIEKVLQITYNNLYITGGCLYGLQGSSSKNREQGGPPWLLLHIHLFHFTLDDGIHPFRINSKLKLSLEPKLVGSMRWVCALILRYTVCHCAMPGDTISLIKLIMTSRSSFNLSP